ncbi:hypothetical protein [Nocardiopsis dassonvillei]|uniref:hypothetical protein n=1 Tax=Nocardiopsis dassonvillei TaxID=2014 RepID=UPI00367279C0
MEWQQLRLDVTVRRDYSAFDRQQHADLTNPTLAHARQVARAFGETRGWSRWVAKDVDRALVILLSLHQPGDRIRFSELAPVLLAHGLSAERTIEVLEHLDLFEDDRTPTRDSWLQHRLGDLAPGIRTDVEDWLRTLHDGGPCTRARSLSTVHGYLNKIDGTLREWSQCFDHLREITRDDVLAAAEGLHGNDRHHMLGALRSLFRHCKRVRSIFRDPTVRIQPAARTTGFSSHSSLSRSRTRSPGRHSPTLASHSHSRWPRSMPPGPRPSATCGSTTWISATAA